MPPGAGPAGIVIQVFKGSSLPTAADAQPLLEHTGWYAMQVHTCRWWCCTHLPTGLLDHALLLACQWKQWE